MAFENKNLSVIAYANGFTLWHYKTFSDTLENVKKDGYFNRIEQLCANGDIIIVNPSDGGAVFCVIEMDGKCVKLTKLRG